MKRKPGVREIGIKKKDAGMALIPWVMLYFFLALLLFLVILTQSLHVSAKYLAEDALASAALAGEVADLEVLRASQDIVITDLDYAKEVITEALQTSLHLSSQGYPSASNVFFDSTVPIEIVELSLYNVADGQVYYTDMLAESGVLQYVNGTEFESEERCRPVGMLQNAAGAYLCKIPMLDGSYRELQNTSLYARIRFGITNVNGSAVIVEQDILTDIKKKES